MKRTLFKTLLAVAALVLVTGCGTRGTRGTPGVAAADEHDQVVRYARCLRAHGVNAPDPPAGDNDIRIQGASPAQEEAARQACKQSAPKAAGGEPSAEESDKLLKIARCMRAHGVSVADPQPGQGLNLPKDEQNAQKNKQLLAACLREVGG
jgi:predicted small lipoprotein YifL